MSEHRKQRKPTKEKDPKISSIIQSSRTKSTISSLLLENQVSPKKKDHFSSSVAAFRGLGCASGAPRVSVPAVIRTSADWETKKVRKKKVKKNKEVLQAVEMGNGNGTGSSGMAMSCGVNNDVCFGPGIRFNTDSVADSSVDCVVARRAVSGRGKVDNHRQRTSYGGRRMVNPDSISFFDAESEFGTSRPELDVFGSRLHRHLRHRSPEGFPEIIMLQSNLLMGGRSYGLDRYRDLRLDVDSMSYEELLDLGDRIGYVSTGLREDDIVRSLRKTKLSTVDELSSDLSEERKCSICQEEYEGDDEMGKLDCGHLYHMECIKSWLVQKNACPICKTAVASKQ